MQEVGVLAVVKELGKFMGDMRQVNSAIDGLRPSGTLLGQMFEAIGNAAMDFGQKIWDVASVTLGVLLRDAIVFVIDKLRDLVSATIEAGNTFQLLRIRLTGLNLNEVSDSVGNYSEAMAEANKMTKEQLTWLQAFGAATPFDPAMIANVYTLARSYGFADEEAKRLTEDVLNFTAGMGLSNDTLELVIRNLGQMVQRGKITSTEMRDLARGSFLPLADVLERVAQKMGITKEELNKLIITQKGVPADFFVKAFEEMVEEEPRFVGAAGRLSRALLPAIQNVKELITSTFGLNVVTPVFDVMGEAVAKVVDQFAFFNEQGELIKTEKWDNLVTAAKNLGQAISQVVQDILGLLPSTESLADGLINAIQGLAVWIGENREGIVGFFKGIGDTIRNEVVPFIRDQLVPAIADFVGWVWENRAGILGFFTGIGDIISNVVVPFVRDMLIPAFQQISDWVTENRPLIDEFFSTVGEIVGEFFSDLMGGNKPGAGEGPLAGLLEGIKNFMQFIIDNKEQVTKFVEILWTVFIVSTVLSLIFSVVASVLGFLIGIVLTAVVGFGTLVGIIALLSNPIALAIAGFLAFGAIIAWLVVYAIMNWNIITAGAQNLWTGLVEIFTNLWNDLVRIFTDLWADLSSVASELWASLKEIFGNLWADLVAIFQNLWTDLKATFTKLWDDLVRLAGNIWNDVKGRFQDLWDSILAIDWLGLGKGIIDGIVNGVRNAMQSLIDILVEAAEKALQAAMKVLGVSSPSKAFMEVGEMTMQGMAIGIKKYAGVVAGAMTEAMQGVVASAVLLPALASPATVANQYAYNSETNTNYNLNIHTNASAEPIVQDFEMLRSMQGR